MAFDPHSNSRIDFRSLHDGNIPPIFPNQARVAVLENFDLLEIIFSFYEPEADVSSERWRLGPAAREGLLNAALTCKDFVDPAMNILWRSMDSIEPLVKILPTFVLVRNNYTVNGAILESHLHRVDLYARRIRRLRLELQHNSWRPIPGFIYQVLASLRPRGLTPALTHLFIPSLRPRAGIVPDSLSILAVSSLLALEIYSLQFETEPSVASFLNIYSAKAPAIKHLAFGDGILQDTFQFLPNFRHVTQLSFKFSSKRTLEIDDLRNCSKMVSLSSLKVVLSEWDIWRDIFPSESTDSVCFDALLELELHGSTSNVGGLLRRMHMTRLQKIVLYLNSRGKLRNLDSFIQQLIQIGQMQSVVLWAGWGPGIGWDILIPLALHACSHIHSLDLILPINSGYHAFLEFCVTLRWPELQSLKLGCPDGIPTRIFPLPSNSIEGQFILSCPKLKSFNVRLL